VAVPAEIAALPEWSAYVELPSFDTLGPLSLACGSQGLGNLLIALTFLWSTARNWKVAQHAALMAIRANNATLASYFANHAVKSSEGNPKARLVLAEALWQRRVPRGMIYQTEAVRMQARSAEPADRVLLRAALIDLNIRAHAYQGNLPEALRWVAAAERSGAVLKLETLLAALACAHAKGSWRLYWRAVVSLVPFVDKLGIRPRSAVERGVHWALLSLIRSHQ